VAFDIRDVKQYDVAMGCGVLAQSIVKDRPLVVSARSSYWGSPPYKLYIWIFADKRFHGRTVRIPGALPRAKIDVAEFHHGYLHARTVSVIYPGAELVYFRGWIAVVSVGKVTYS